MHILTAYGVKNCSIKIIRHLCLEVNDIDNIMFLAS